MAVRTLSMMTVAVAVALSSTQVMAQRYPVVDTGQDSCYDASGEIACPTEGEAFCGQDPQHTGNLPAYIDNGDGTVSDLVTGLMWQQSPDTDGDVFVKAFRVNPSGDPVTIDALAGSAARTARGPATSSAAFATSA